MIVDQLATFIEKYSITTVFAGIVGAFLKHTYELTKRKLEYWRLKRVLPITTNDPSFLVVTSLVPSYGGSPPKTYRNYVHSGETLALAKIMRRTQKKKITVSFETFYYQKFTEPRNCLFFGSPAWAAEKLFSVDNKKIKILNFGPLQYISQEGKHDRIQKLDGDWHWLPQDFPPYVCDHAPATSEILAKFQNPPEDLHVVTRDYGVIVRKPLGDGKVGLLLCGLHSHGTQAAAEVAISDEFYKRVKRAGCKYYAQLVRCEVEPDGLTLKNTHWDDYPLIELSPASVLHRWVGGLSNVLGWFARNWRK